MNTTLSPLPLVDALAARGGLPRCLVSAGIVQINHDPETGEPITRVEGTTEYERWKKKMQRMTKRGSATVYQVDEFCIKMLKAHPSEIYGEDWWDAIDDEMSMDYMHEGVA